MRYIFGNLILKLLENHFSSFISIIQIYIFFILFPTVTVERRNNQQRTFCSCTTTSLDFQVSLQIDWISLPKKFCLWISKIISTFYFIFSGTIRENILFGLEYDPDKYDKVIADCALEDDFLAMKGGDTIHIGGAGANLSGGQMQRLNLGRHYLR